ncbi:Por secretion system C-terminal sorting domain-containing protein [Chryseobacterium soldanellicola]|uniref:Por secretion system C-terminal sorting domain-containing protein n=1 Tax=Chryseobacterium soldanellicola TaxID=311333 RepID=A0A1H0XU29_9FLAO|nr:choice-of-anchor J domain-containing protein [Chryseobacterium soldanellicola]SDQ06321.1 Por secretion system C-terminal sorting domain-containing protein [Chryseobacterium soldanellicola]
MKLRLLLGTLMLTAITANAQVATINENFDGFTSGNNTFPQNGWSTIMAANPMPFPPAPLMIVTTDANKAIQAYSGNNTNAPSYLVTPQIVAPSGDKSVSFTVTLASPSPGPGSVQVGLASNPADMTTFVPVGNSTTLSTVGAIQNITVPIPASASQYIVFRFTPTAAHVAIQIDNVVYNTTASLGTTDTTKSSENVKFAVNSDNTALQFVAKKEPKNIQIFSALGQNVAEGKLNGQKFDISALQTGVYYIIIETAEGSVIKSKFIKK